MYHSTLTRIWACEQLQKICEHEQASTWVIFASNLSKGQILRAILNRMGPFNTPTYGTLVRGEPSAYYAISANCNILYTLNIYNLSNESFWQSKACFHPVSLICTPQSCPCSLILCLGPLSWVLCSRPWVLGPGSSACPGSYCRFWDLGTGS